MPSPSGSSKNTFPGATIELNDRDHLSPRSAAGVHLGAGDARGGAPVVICIDSSDLGAYGATLSGLKAKTTDEEA